MDRQEWGSPPGALLSDSGGVARWAHAALAVLLLVAAGIRLSSVAFGLPALNDPDELTFELCALHMLRGSTLNPGWFGHPATTTIYLLAALTVAVFGVGRIAGWFPSIAAFGDAIYNDPSWIILPGRVVMVIFALGTIYLTYLLARDLFDRRTALVATTLLAFNPVHITWSQIIRSDMMACFFMLLCLRAAVRIAHSDRWGDYVLAAMWLGAAMATKWPYAVAGLSVVAAAMPHMMRPGTRARTVLRVRLFGALTLVFLLAISPYLLLDYSTALKNVLGEAQPHHLGATGGTPWANAWWYLTVPIRTGLGTLGLAMTVWGLTIIARRRDAGTVLLPTTLAFIIILCLQHIVWERWVLAIMPMLSIAAAVGLTALWRLLAGRARPKFAFVVTSLVLAAMIVPLGLRAQADARARLNDTRQLASQWARAHIAPGKTVMIEHFAFDLQPMPWHFLFPLGEMGCADARALLKGKVELSKIDGSRGGHSNIDYGTVSPKMRDTCRADYAILTQYDRYAADREHFPAEYSAYRDLLARGVPVATFIPEDGRIGGPVVRIIRFDR